VLLELAGWRPGEVVNRPESIWGERVRPGRARALASLLARELDVGGDEVFDAIFARRISRFNGSRSRLTR
jgi:hypothetical protein